MATLASTQRRAASAASTAVTSAASAATARRAYASAAASASTSSSPSSSSSASQPPPIRPAPTKTSKTPSSSSRINVSLLLSRQPVILREPTELEGAVHAYNHQLTRRLAQPFKSDFYYRQGSAGQVRFAAEEEQRRVKIDGEKPGSASGAKKGNKSTGAAVSSSTAAAEADSSSAPAQLPRTTDADAQNDTTSLKRRLDETLFLVYKDARTQSWRFPTRVVDVENSETLHRVAPLTVTEAIGDKLDIWLVTNMPVGLARNSGDKTYYMRGHVLSGKPTPQPLNKNVVAEYAWLTRDEIRERMAAKDEDRVYLEGVRELL